MHKKIVLFISELIPGGAIKQIIELSRFLQKDYEVILITWFKHSNEHYEIPSDVQRYYLANSKPDKRDIITVIRKIRETRNFLKQINPDVTISFLHEINAWNILSSLGLKKTKKIISVREYPKFNVKNFRSLIYKVLSNYASVLVCQTSEIKEWLVENNYRSEIVVIPNIISQNTKHDFTKSYLQTVEGNYILAIGTKVFQKGFDLLLKAYDGAVLKGLKIPLRIVGLGIPEEYKELVKLKNELSCGELVQIEGYSKDLEDIYSNALFLVFSSRFEGIPNVLLEAITHGLPIVAFDCPTGPRQVLSDGELGVLVPHLDVNSLEESILKMATDQDFRTEYADKLSQINIDNVEEVGKLWTDLINQP